MLKMRDILHAVTGDDGEEKPAHLDTRVKPVIRVINGALDEDESSLSKVVVTGRIDQHTLRFLKVDQSYQRPLENRPEIFQALKDGIVVPSIDIGVRGQTFSSDGNDILIDADAYIIDGWQRVGNALRVLELDPNHPIRMFATIHFDTNPLWERHRFTELNKNIRKVSPGLHLRNMRDRNTAVATLYGLCHNEPNFAFYERVCWSQAMKRGDLIQALGLAKAARRLHAHLYPTGGAGIPKSTGDGLAHGLMAVASKARLDVFRNNVATFASVIQECWGVTDIEYRNKAPQIKSQFMLQLARLFDTHFDFWDGTERGFFVSADLRRKLAKFRLTDPYIAGLCGAGGSAGNILYDMLVKHMNSGRRTGHLRSRFDR